MTVYENVSFGLKMQYDLSKSEMKDRVAEVLEVVELPGYEDRKIPTLSGGEQQRIALARALVVEPDVLLYDEPLSDLDRQLRETMRREIKDIHEEYGITSIYVTHNQREALTLSDRVAVMNSGKVVRCDPPSEIYMNPQTRFVADFVGDSNFVSGRVEREADTWRFRNETIDVEIDSPPSDGPEESAILVIRPENVQLDAGDGKTTFPGEIESVIHLGSTTEYTVSVGEHSLISVALGHPTYEEGDAVTVSLRDCELIGEE
jgi:ABC-type Fe3+/spermidine/putrescine transport system ATPase subunit